METHAGERLIEEQIRRWELARQVKPEVRPKCVTLSRLPGTPAAELGQRLAERLGYGFFGIELVDEVARTEKVARYLVAQLDEHVRNGLDRWLMDTFHGHTYNEQDYLKNVARTVSALGDKGGAVLLGRGAPFLLGTDKALKVQVIAPREDRVKRLAEVRGCDEDAASRELAREEADRLKFLRSFTPDPDDPLHFHIIVNTGLEPIDYWVEVLVNAVEHYHA